MSENGPQEWTPDIARSSGGIETMAWMAASRRPPDDVVLPGVTAGEWVQFLSRPETPKGSRYESAVTYGTAGDGGRTLPLFLYARENPSERRPGVVFVHGGGWHNLHPFMHIRHANALAAMGYVTATISYRLYPEATMDDAVADVKCALRWCRANAGALGLDPDRLAVAGGSAGGHLAGMVATTPGLFEGTGGNNDVSSSVAAAVLWYPITDLRVRESTWPGLAGGIVDMVGSAEESELLRLSPLRHVSPATPPVLTIGGDADALVPVPMLQDFHAALDREGVANELHIFDGAGHAFDLRPDDWRTCFDLMADFLERHLNR